MQLTNPPAREAMGAFLDLVRLMRDPAALEAHLKDIDSKVADLTARESALSTAQIDAVTIKNALDKRQSEMADKVAWLNAETIKLADKDDALKARERDLGTAQRIGSEALAKRAQEIATDKAALDKATVETDKRHTETTQKLYDREVALMAREKAAGIREAKLTAGESDYNTRITKLKEIAG